MFMMILSVVMPVSIHAPARGAMVTSSPLCQSLSFNSRTREGCDPNFEKVISVYAVSIHAPARGAIPVLPHAVPTTGFNSRTREGCDLKAAFLKAIDVFQFTHPRGVRSAPET